MTLFGRREGQGPCRSLRAAATAPTMIVRGSWPHYDGEDGRGDPRQAFPSVVLSVVVVWAAAALIGLGILALRRLLV